jgi:hypothetical protein
MNATQTKKTTYACGKCEGRGFLRSFSHIANGVCFACEGTGKVTVKDGFRKAFDWETNRKKIMFIIDMSVEDMNKMTYAQVVAMDDYVHMMTMDRKCMWLYRYYCENLRNKALEIMNGY